MNGAAPDYLVLKAVAPVVRNQLRAEPNHVPY